jgi:hypothetical protein
VLSVAPSGKAAFFWWRARELEPLRFGVRFMVRVRPAADEPWGPAQALSPAIDSRNRYLDGDVAMNNDGTGMAAWSVNAVTSQFLPGAVRRSALTRSGVWTAPTTMTTSSVGGLELESAPNGFTAIKWLRRGENDTSRTVVANSTGSGWVRGIVGGVHDSLAVGQGGTVVMVKVLPPRQGLQLTWHSSRSEWSTHTLAPTNTAALARELAVDGAGRIVALWSQGRGNYPRNGERAFMSSHLIGWSTAGVWDWTRHAFLAAADVSPNGRAVAIRTVTNTQQTRTAVAMRVFRPG